MIELVLGEGVAVVKRKKKNVLFCGCRLAADHYTFDMANGLIVYLIIYVLHKCASSSFPLWLIKPNLNIRECPNPA